MTSRQAAEAWIAGYRLAWSTNSPDDIRSLFAEDATYRPTPFGAGWVGREAIVAGWLARRDAPGAWTFEHRVLAVEGDLAVIEGRTRYPEVGAEYSNLWVVRLGDDGRAREYTEWWVDRAADDPGAPPSPQP